MVGRTDQLNKNLTTFYFLLTSKQNFISKSGFQQHLRTPVTKTVIIYLFSLQVRNSDFILMYTDKNFRDSPNHNY